jgi:DNA-binding transcriptional ArsR family regulator
VKPVVKIIDDPAVIKIAVEETRRQILTMLNEQEMTLSEIARKIKKDISTVYRHIHQLQRAGLVEVVGEKRVHHIPEKVYGRTAKLFLYSPEAAEQFGRDLQAAHIIPSVHMLIDLLQEMGYDVENSEEFRDNLGKILIRFNVLTAQALERLSPDREMEISISIYILLMLITGLINLDLDQDLSERVKRFRAGVREK